MTFARLRVFLIVAGSAFGAALVLGIVFSNLPPDGTLSAVAFPAEPSPFVGPLRPAQRVSVIDTGEGLAYAAKDEPLYFQLTVPPFFRSASLRVEYAGDAEGIAVGGRVHPEEWRFDLRPLETVERGETWTTGETVFDLGPLFKDDRGEVQMVVSLPGLARDPVLFRRITVEYRRPPLTVESILDAASRRLSF